MQADISVVIPTYRRPGLLRNCLNALMHQTIDKSRYEILVVSDGYDALTEKVVQAYTSVHPWLKYLYLNEKKGPAAARNLGWMNAKSNLIAFTDDDTLPDATWLDVYCRTYKGEHIIAYTGKVKVPVSSPPTDYEKNIAGLETADFVTANCCCTKAALEKTGGFDERFSMAWREDSDLEFRLLLHHIPIIRYVEAWVVHPVRQAPWGISIKEQKKVMFNALLYKKHPRLYRQKIRKRPLWNYYIMVVSLLFLIVGIITHLNWLSIAAFACWMVLQASFVQKRLNGTSRAASHIAEMVVTSLIIPFASLYWHFYGALKYRVLFL